MESSPHDQRVPRAAVLAGLPWPPLAWSLGLHGLVLAVLAPVWISGESGVPPVRVLQTRLQPVAPVIQSVPVIASAPPVLSSPQPARLMRPLPAAIESSAVPPAPTFAEGSIAAREARPAGGEVVSAAQLVSPNVALAPPEAELPDAAGLREYRLALAGEARRFRRYPEQARRRGWSGTAEVRIAVSPLQRQAELVRSSGHPPLDVAALAMLQQAVAHTPLPPSLHQQQFTVLLPVVFEVED